MNKLHRENLINMTEAETVSLLRSMGEKDFRGRQVFNWVSRGVDSIEDMVNLPKDIRCELKKVSYLERLKAVTVQRSGEDGTHKYLFCTEDGHGVESVLMKYKYGNSLCISSQIGCRMGCSFCASTLSGCIRGLTGGEMMDQVLMVHKESNKEISRIVVMGMGEPMDNLAELFRFLQMINNKNGVNMGWRNITVSTCGLVPGIMAMAKEYPQVNLAVSLHSAISRVRADMMPVESAYPIKELIKACRQYVHDTGRRITFEYALIKGINDGEEDIRILADLLRGINCHVNLIPLNPVKDTEMKGSSHKEAIKISNTLEKLGIPTTVRRSFGKDIEGACGQLRNSFRK